MATGEFIVATGFAFLASCSVAHFAGCNVSGRDLRGDCEAVAANLTEVGDAFVAERWDAEHDVEAMKAGLRGRLEPENAEEAVDLVEAGWKTEREAHLNQVRAEMSVLAGQLVPRCVEELRDSPDRVRAISCLTEASSASEINACGEFDFMGPSRAPSP